MYVRCDDENFVPTVKFFLLSSEDNRPFVFYDEVIAINLVRLFLIILRLVEPINLNLHIALWSDVTYWI